MKYISRKLQVYLSENQKKEYKKLLKIRMEYIRNNPLQPVKMHNRWSNKTWTGIPSARNYFWIINPKDKEQYQIHKNRIFRIHHKIKVLEMSAYENKEKEICKEGFLLIRQSRIGKGKKYLVQGKESRDYYILVDVTNLQSRSVKWLEIVRCYELDEVSK
tara:strand:- start:67 stop:546 length:480 start_codon:yes stop_codon:yes gene_type:complete